MSLVVTIAQLREEIGGPGDDPRFAEHIADDTLQGIIDRHVASFDSRAEEAIATQQLPPEAFRHLAEPVDIELVPDLTVAIGDFPANYVRYSYGAFDSDGHSLTAYPDLLFFADVSPFEQRRYRIVGSHVEVLPKTLDLIHLYLMLTTDVRDALLSGAYAGLGYGSRDLNRDIILDARKALADRITMAKVERDLSDLEP